MDHFEMDTTANVSIGVISPDDNLRLALAEAIEASGLPVDLGIEIDQAVADLDPSYMEDLKAAAPELVILDMSKDPAQAVLTAGAIAARNPKMSMIGVGPQLESSCLLDGVRAGLVEYLLRPVEAHNVADALERVLRKRGWSTTTEGGRDGQLLAFFAAKGGAGSTSIVTNAAIELHRRTRKKVLLVDLDLELGEIASLLGIDPRFHFVDLIRNFHRMDANLLDSYIERHESGVQVLSAPFEPQIAQEVTGQQIAETLNLLRSHFDYVLVDTSKSLGPSAMAALDGADHIYLVTNLDVPSLRNLKRCLPILDRVTAGDAERLRLLVNRYHPKSIVRLADLEEAVGLDVYMTLANDFKTVITAMSTGQPLVLNGSSKLGGQLKELARRMAQDQSIHEPHRPSLMGRLISPFRPKASQPAPEAIPAMTEEVVSNG